MKIAISRIDRMGDLILTLPVIQTIKVSNPLIEIHVFVSNKNSKVIKNFKYVDKIYNIDKKFKLNNHKYDYFFNFSPGWRSFFLCFFARSRKKANLIYTSRYKNNFFSKLLIKILSKIFFNKNHIVNRIKQFNNNQSIHQTEMMYELISKCNISIKNKFSLKIFLPKLKDLLSPKKICLIHLSSKWINKYYNEKNFINLINLLKDKFTLALTTDETTKDKFNIIYNKYPIITNEQFNSLSKFNTTTIFQDLNFENWVQAIYSANFVITPECGCTHVASICKINSKIIYDPENMPQMIHAEYHPWENYYEKFFFNDKNINLNLIKKL